MPKILYIITQSELGGAQRYVFDLAVNFKQRGYEVAVATGGNGPLVNQLESHQIQTHRLKHLVRAINPRQDAAAYFELKRLCKTIQPDIVHLNSSKAGVLGAIAGKHAGVKKIIYTVHGFVFNEPLLPPIKKFYRAAEKFAGRYKDTLICVSEFDRQRAKKNKIGSDEKLITIHNGTPQNKLLTAAEARARLNLSTNQIIIGTIARFYPTKRLTDLITAAQTVVKKFPDALFVVIGDGQQRPLLESAIQKNTLGSNFKLLGAKEDPEQYLPAFNLYVSSSVKEGLPYSILAAMLAAVPIVTTNVGGIPEMIQDSHNGLLVKPQRPEQLAQAILTLLEKKDLAHRLARQAKHDARQNFSLEKMLAETESVYQH